MEELSAVVLLQRILDDAILRRSSDIHMHAGPDALEVQFRVAGELHPYLRLTQHGPAVIRRIKALAKMDLSETRIPQDGSFRWITEQSKCDIRVAAIPTIGGEALVLRLLLDKHEPVSFTTLGMTEGQSAQLCRILSHTTGLVLVAGPTGSGKTTTLYAMMLQLSRWGRHVVSIEDPVESPVPNCQQVEVRERVGVTFDVGLRALLRHDPDVIMVGEIRDEQTARVSVRAALSGHLVLSTTHATDLVGAAARLVDFGLSRFALADVLRAVIVQELVPAPCLNCKGAVCQACGGSGVLSSRVGRYRLYEVTPGAASLLAADMPWSEIRTRIVKLGDSNGHGSEDGQIGGSRQHETAMDR